MTLKKNCLICMVLMITLLFPCIANADQSVKVKYNDQIVNFEIQPIIEDSRVYVPMSVVVKECSTLFEIAFRRIFNEAIISLPFKERLELQECEKKIGKNLKGVQDFTFGELVGLFRESALMNKWVKHSARDHC